MIQIHVNTRTTSQLRTAIPLRAQTPEKDRSRDSHRHTLRTRQPEGWQHLKLGYNNEVNTFSMALAASTLCQPILEIVFTTFSLEHVASDD